MKFNNIPFTFKVKRVIIDNMHYYEGTVKELPDVAVYENTIQEAMDSLRSVSIDLYNQLTEDRIGRTIVNKKSFVYCSFTKEGYHAYPEAATDPTLKTGDKYDVSHLGERHFHYFYFKVWIEVNHSHRDIEFIQFRRWLESLYNDGSYDGSLELNSQSCEMLSDSLAAKISERYPNREIIIDVSEENINGSYTVYSA